MQYVGHVDVGSRVGCFADTANPRIAYKGEFDAKSLKFHGRGVFDCAGVELIEGDWYVCGDFTC